MTNRTDVVRMARSYLNTPFHHRGRLPGVGLDCVGLLVCVARELALVPPNFDIPPYSINPDGQVFLDWCNRYMTNIPAEAMQPGDAIVLIVDQHPQHLGILGDYLYGGLSIIHAASGLHPPRVVETGLMFNRIQKFSAAYVLPGIV